jgi:hypothetical protein
MSPKRTDVVRRLVGREGRPATERSRTTKERAEVLRRALADRRLKRAFDA